MRPVLRILLAVVLGMASSVAAASSEGLRKELFVDQYIEAIREKPEIYLTHMAWIFDVTQPSTLPEINAYGKMIKDADYNTALSKFMSYLPEMGLGLGASVPIVGGLSVKFDAKYDLKPILMSVTRSLVGVSDPKEIRRRLNEISQQDPESLRWLGELVYVSHNNSTKEFARFAPMFRLAELAQPSLPSPNGPPSAYLKQLSNPYIRSWAQARLSLLPDRDRQRILANWPEFTKFMGEIVSPQISTKLLSRSAAPENQRIANQSKRSESVHYGVEDVLSAVLSDKIAKEVLAALRAENHARTTVPEYYQLEEQLRKVQGVLRQATELADVMRSPDSVRMIQFTTGMVELTFNVGISLAAHDAHVADAADTAATLAMVSSGLGAVTAGLKLYSMYAAEREDGSAAIYKALFENQRRILLQLNQVSQEIQRLSQMAGEMRAVMNLESRIQVLQFREMFSRLDEISSEMTDNKDEIMSALKQSFQQSAKQVAARLSSRAQNKKLMAALVNEDPNIAVRVLEDFSEFDVYLKSTVTLTPILPSRTIDSLVSEKRIPAEPWSYIRDTSSVVESAAERLKENRRTSLPGIKNASQQESTQIDSAIDSYSKARADKLVFANPDAFFQGALLMADAGVRFPASYIVPVDLIGIRATGDQTAKLMQSVVVGAAVLQHVIRSDLVDVRSKWDSMVQQTIDSAIPADLDSLGAADWVNRYFRSTNLQSMSTDFDCAATAACPTKVGLPRQDPIEFLTGLGVVTGRIRYVRDTDSDWQLSIGKPSRMCFNVRRVVPWTRNSLNKYSSSIGNTDRGSLGYFLEMKKVCRSFGFQFDSADQAGQWSRMDKPAFIWTRYFEDDIHRLFVDANALPVQDQLALRNESRDSASRILNEKSSSVRLVMKEASAKAFAAPLIEALRVLDRDVGALFISGFAMTHVCQKRLLIQYVNRVLELDPARKTLFGSSGRVSKALEQDDFALVDRLIGGEESTMVGPVVDASDCYQQPKALALAMQYIEVLERRLARQNGRIVQ